jgi:hypothetical protein
MKKGLKHRPSARRGLSKNAQGDGFTQSSQENFFEPFDKLRFESPNPPKERPAFNVASPISPSVFSTTDAPDTPILVPTDPAQNPFAFTAWSKILAEANEEASETTSSLNKAATEPPAPATAEKTIPPEVALELAKLPALQMEQERLVHDVQMLKSDNAWYKAQLATAQQNMTASKAELLLAQQTLLAEREASRNSKKATAPPPAENVVDKMTILKLQQELRAANARFEALQKEMESQPRLHEFQLRVNALEAEVRQGQKEAAEWRAEKTNLERDATLWRGRLEASTRKESVAKEHVEEAVRELEKILLRSGSKEFLKFVYRTYPPKNGKALGSLDSKTLDRTLRNALVDYHVDKQDFEIHGLTWKALCLSISQLINGIRQK